MAIAAIEIGECLLKFKWPGIYEMAYLIAILGSRTGLRASQPRNGQGEDHKSAYGGDWSCAVRCPPVHAQPNPTIGLSSEKLEFALLEKSAVFELASISGALKETRQYGQQLIWRVKERPSAEAFRMANLSVGLLRSDTGSQVIATFSGDISSLGYTTSEEVKLHIIFRTKGGVALHTSVVGIRIKCDDKDQSMHPPTDVIPRNIANHVFANVTSVEIAAHTEPHLSVVKILRCN